MCEASPLGRGWRGLSAIASKTMSLRGEAEVTSLRGEAEATSLRGEAELTSLRGEAELTSLRGEAEAKKGGNLPLQYPALFHIAIS
jgi:uncharacterized membrane protein YqiK